MALNISQLKNRLSALSNQGGDKKSNLIWKPKPGKQVVRIVPYKFNPENPFIELKFHYNLNGKTYLSPDSFGRPDPIVEFSNRLKKTGSKEDWQMGRKMEPKLRTFAPVLVRGEESEGVKFWGFGKTVYQELIDVCLDPEYGDITDPAQGRDITVEFKTAEEVGKSFPETTVRVKPNTSPAVDPKNKDSMELLKNQSNILDMFPELSYEELNEVMDAWLNPDDVDEESIDSVETETSEEVVETSVEEPTVARKSKKSAVASPSAAASKKSSMTDDVSKAFDDLFNS